MASKTQQQQIEIMDRLQLKMLQRFETLLDNGEISSTDMATLVRLAEHNGWQLDPAKIPQGLKDKLTAGVSPEDFGEDDGKVLHMKAAR